MEEKKNQVNRLFASQLWVVNVGVEVFFRLFGPKKSRRYRWIGIPLPAETPGWQKSWQS